MQETYFWKYQGNARNYPGYHLSLNAESAEAISERLNSRLSMQMERSIKFNLIKPSEAVLSVPNNRRHQALSKSHLELSIRFDEDSEFLQISETSDVVSVELSKSKTKELLDGIKGLMTGENDYAMWGENQSGAKICIWFW